MILLPIVTLPVVLMAMFRFDPAAGVMVNAPEAVTILLIVSVVTAKVFTVSVVPSNVRFALDVRFVPLI